MHLHLLAGLLRLAIEVTADDDVLPGVEEQLGLDRELAPVLGHGAEDALLHGAPAVADAAASRWREGTQRLDPLDARIEALQRFGVVAAAERLVLLPDDVDVAELHRRAAGCALRGRCLLRRCLLDCGHCDLLGCLAPPDVPAPLLKASRAGARPPSCDRTIGRMIWPGARLAVLRAASPPIERPGGGRVESQSARAVPPARGSVGGFPRCRADLKLSARRRTAGAEPSRRQKETPWTTSTDNEGGPCVPPEDGCWRPLPSPSRQPVCSPHVAAPPRAPRPPPAARRPRPAPRPQARPRPEARPRRAAPWRSTPRSG